MPFWGKTNRGGDEDGSTRLRSNRRPTGRSEQAGLIDVREVDSKGAARWRSGGCHARLLRTRSRADASRPLSRGGRAAPAADATGVATPAPAAVSERAGCTQPRECSGARGGGDRERPYQPPYVPCPLGQAAWRGRRAHRWWPDGSVQPAVRWDRWSRAPTEDVHST